MSAASTQWLVGGSTIARAVPIVDHYTHHYCPSVHHHHHHNHHQSLNDESHWITTKDLAISFLQFSQFPTSHWDLANSRPAHLRTPSSHLLLCFSSLFWYALQDAFVQTWWMRNMAIPLQFVSRYNYQIFVWSNYQLDLSTPFFIGKLLFIWDVWYLVVAPHFHGLYSPSERCCEGPWFTSVQEDGCDKGAQHHISRITTSVAWQPTTEGYIKPGRALLLWPGSNKPGATPQVGASMLSTHYFLGST